MYNQSFYQVYTLDIHSGFPASLKQRVVGTMVFFMWVVKCEGDVKLTSHHVMGDVKLILQYQDHKVQRLGFPRETPLQREQTKKTRKENFFSSMKRYLRLIRDILIWEGCQIFMGN